MGTREIATEEQLIEAYKDPYNISRIRNWANKYYEDAASLTIEFHNEYDDEGYNTHVRYVDVFDKKGNSILPIKEKAKESRDGWDGLPRLYYDNLTNRIYPDVKYYVEYEVVDEVNIEL